MNQLAWFIIDRCASNVYDQQLHTHEKFDFLGMFHYSIADVVSSTKSSPETRNQSI